VHFISCYTNQGEKPKSKELGLLTSHEVSYPVKALKPDWISGFVEAA
jgi:hypothetical protein